MQVNFCFGLNCFVAFRSTRGMENLTVLFLRIRRIRDEDILRIFLELCDNRDISKESDTESGHGEIITHSGEVKLAVCLIS